MKRIFLLFAFSIITLVGNAQQPNGNTIKIDSDFGILSFTKTCTETDGIYTTTLLYKAQFFLDDIFSNPERKQENVTIKIMINEAGEIDSYEYLKQPVSFDLTRFFNNFFKDIIRNKGKYGNKGLNCSQKRMVYVLYFRV